MEIGVSLKPYESIFDGMIEIETGSRAAFRGESVIDPDNAHTHGLAEHPRELTGADDEPVDAEIIDAEPMTPDASERDAPGDSAPEFSPFTPAHPPDAGLLPFDVAVSAAAAMRRDAARIRRAQRALPRGSRVFPLR
jgi:hypothetical protein